MRRIYRTNFAKYEVIEPETLEVAQALNRDDVFCSVHEVRLHNFCMKFPVLKAEEVSPDWKKVEMTNWSYLYGKFEGFSVKRTPDALIVWAKVLRGKDPFQLHYQAMIDCWELALKIQDKFKMILGVPVTVGKPHFGVYDPLGLGEKFLLDNDLGKFDASEGKGEVEFYGPI